jgi:magnesium transporter
MKAQYELQGGSVVSCPPDQANILVYTSPTDSERNELRETLQMDLHDLESALDPDEVSRADVDPEYTYIIWKRPNNVSFEQALKFEVSSVGLYLQNDRLTIILGEGTVPFEYKEFRGAASVRDVMLKLFLHTIHHFLGHLKAIKQINAELQSKLNLTMENRYLMQMFTLGESLIYYLNALEANSLVLTRVRASAEKIGLSPGEIERLDDLIIDHQQCTRQTQILSSVLSGLMEARGSIVNNNMNVLLKNLTLINVVFLPLNLLASIGGMSEFSMMTSEVHWVFAYSSLLLGMVALGVGTYILIVRRMDRGQLKTRRISLSRSLRKRFGLKPRRSG